MQTQSDAKYIIQYLGGARRMSEILGVHLSSVYRWRTSIPTRYHQKILAYSAQHGLNLKPEDLSPSDLCENNPSNKNIHTKGHATYAQTVPLCAEFFEATYDCLATELEMQLNMRALDMLQKSSPHNFHSAEYNYDKNKTKTKTNGSSLSNLDNQDFFAKLAMQLAQRMMDHARICSTSSSKSEDATSSKKTAKGTHIAHGAARQ